MLVCRKVICASKFETDIKRHVAGNSEQVIKFTWPKYTSLFLITTTVLRRYGQPVNIDYISHGKYTSLGCVKTVLQHFHSQKLLVSSCVKTIITMLPSCVKTIIACVKRI